jgi:hypothetical protein
MGRNFASDVVTVLGRFKLCPTLASPPLPRLLDCARPFGAFRLRQGSFPIERTRHAGNCRQLLSHHFGHSRLHTTLTDSVQRRIVDAGS